MKLAIMGTSDSVHLLKIFRNAPESGFEIVAFIDLYKEKKEELPVYCGGLPLLSIETLKEKYPHEINGVFYATQWVSKAEYFLLRLYDLNIRQVYVPKPRCIESRVNFLEGAENGVFNPEYVYTPNWEKPFIFRLETHVVDHCNLNCKSCNNFSTLEHCERFRSPEQYDKDLARLKELFDTVCILGLQGGEPLLDAERSLEFAHIARKHFPNSDIRIHTNGLLVPKTDPAIFESLRELNVTTQISIYQPTKNILDEIKSTLDSTHNDYFLFENKDDFFRYITEFPFEDATWNSHHCGSIGCHYLSDGYIFKCPESELVRNLDTAFGTSIHSDSGFDLHIETNAWQLLRNLNQSTYLCSYCCKTNVLSSPWSNDKDYSRNDWLTPHRYEREKQSDNAKIAALLTSAESCSDENRSLLTALAAEKTKATELQASCGSLLEENKRMSTVLDAQSAKVAEVMQVNQRQQSVLEKHLAEKNKLEAETAELQKRISETTVDLKQAHEMYTAVVTSRSWQITKPLRVVADWVKGFLR